MESGVENQENTSESAREPRPLLYVSISATVAALILGMTVFLLVRGFQWRAALADLRAEPGIEILSTERFAFFKKRLLGLRDPLAPKVEAILRKHNIGPNSYELHLTEYHSLNTPYSVEREIAQQNEIDEIRSTMVDALTEFSLSLTKTREADLEKITQMLFEARFPMAMQSVDLDWKDGAWYVTGELFGPDHQAFIDTAPEYIVEGDLDFSGLKNLTETLGSSLQKLIETPNLLAEDLDGNLVHLDRMARLVADFDTMAERSDILPPKLQLEVENAKLSDVSLELEFIRESLLSHAHIDEERFYPDFATEPKSGDAPSIHLKLIPSPLP